MDQEHISSIIGPQTLRGKVEAVLVSGDFTKKGSVEVEKIQVICNEGIKWDVHGGKRLLDAREHDLLEMDFGKGTEVANIRQFSAVSVEEYEQIKLKMELPRDIRYGALGENIVVKGIPHFSLLPPGTKLFFTRGAKALETAVLLIMEENGPCIEPGKEIEKDFAELGKVAGTFVKAAMGLRGVVGIVYTTGFIRKGDTVIAKIPQQRIYTAIAGGTR
ncbi:MAG: MOSC domain-containing protein [Patescibacteria group bacterium]